MRLRPRPTVKETLTYDTANDAAFGGVELPRKAQKLLGAKVQVNVSNSSENKRDDFVRHNKAEQRNLGTRYAAQRAPQIPLPSGITDMPSWSTAITSSRSGSDALPTPPATSHLDGYYSPGVYSPSVGSKPFSREHQQSTESMNREYYDSSKQPLYVSQQTSASAVRDMALRKGSPRVHEMASDQIPPRLSSKAVSNAQNGNDVRSASRIKGENNSKKPTKLDLTSLFPRPNASASQARLLSPAKYAQSPSAMTDLTEFFPQETMHAELRRQGADGRFQTHRSPQTSSIKSSNTPRVKIFEPDIYHNSKMRSRKPPQGIKNWFDGFDISSDEDEITPVELPANTPRPSVEAIPSDFSPYGLTAPARNVTNGVYSPSRPAENLHPMVPARATRRRRMQSRSSASSTITEDSCGATGGQKRSGESRFAHSRLDSQSVLSLSSESEEEEKKAVLSPVRDSRYAIDDEPTLTANLPSPVPRKLVSQTILAQGTGLRTKDSTISTSGSIPIRLRDSTAAPMVVEDLAVPLEARVVTLQPPQSAANGSGERQVRSRATTGSVNDRQGLTSAGGETSSSVPSDASRVMAVTEEEMMLLELMRKKRAAMQNNSFQEGYRLALKQEQDFMSKRQQPVHNSVDKPIEDKVNKEERISPIIIPEQPMSKNIESKGPLPPNRYSVFQRLPNVAKGFNIDRYLAMEPPQEEPPLSPNAESEAETQDEPQEEPYVAKMARMERFLMMKPSLADAIQQERPLSGTEIETDTMAATEDEDAPSPMARLAGMGREKLRVRSPLMDDDDNDEEDLPEDSDVGYDEHHDRVRAFLQSSKASELAGNTTLSHIDSDVQSEGEEALSDPPSPQMLEDSQQTPRVADQQIPALLTTDVGGFQPSRSPSVGSEHPLPQPVSKFQDRSESDASSTPGPTELPSSRIRPSPISTGVASPLSQSFTNSISDRPVEVSRSPSYANAPYIATTAKRISKLPTRIDTTGTKAVGRITSMSSMTSAGEDVLAAWAELGGGSDALAARRRAR